MSSTGTLLLLIITIILLGVGFLGTKGVNTSQTERSGQFIIPFVAAVYCIVIMPFVSQLTALAMSIVGLGGSALSGLSDISVLPLQVQQWLADGGDNINDMVNDPSSFTSFVFLNLFILAAYLIIKFILIKTVVKGINADPLSAESIKGLCYEYSMDNSGWFLKENFVQARDLLKALFWFTCFFTGLLLVVSVYFFRFNFTQALFYPVFCVIMVSELYFYLDGMSLPYYKNNVLGEKDGAEKEANYSLLRASLKRLFGDKLLADDVETTYTVAEDTTMEDVVRLFEDDEDPVVNNLAEFIKTIQGNSNLDTNYLYSMRDLLNGKSILFNNPFYRDLIPYAFYPMNRKLLAHKKVLIILGRHAVEDDAIDWLRDGIASITNLPDLWRIGVLSEEKQDVDIGILTRSSVYDINIHSANQAFLDEVEFVVILEPSKMISTSQIGLNLLVKRIKASDDNNVTYCLCDKNCDGIVDAMSHILMTELTEVSATNKHTGTSSFMCWEADDEYLHHRLMPNISRYLGMGTEMAFVALKNGISKARWFGGDVFPVKDIKWIAKQYYHDLLNYAELPANQDTMNEHFETSSNMWGAEVNDMNYITVEDEACNMFEMFREFSTRAKKQGFVNIISSNYLLKDYMADNAGIFKTDAKAIPNIVADYIRSDRNVTLRLLLMMSTYPVDADTIRNELSLLGIKIYDLKKQLWFEIFKCFASVNEISNLSKNYREAVEQVSEMELHTNYKTFSSEILVEQMEYNFYKGYEERVYTIKDKDFLETCITSLKSAAYVAEDEKGEKNYLGSELYDHIYSRHLPGQFFTFGGKYYEMLYLTADGQVLIRRAADHITGRPSYRQIRDYLIEGIMPSEMIGASRDVDGIKVSRIFADVSVDTLGYYRMAKYDDFKTAKKVLFDNENNGILNSKYKNKEILAIDLPEIDGLTDKVRYTITLMLNEVFKTIFADEQAFVSAVTDCSFMGDDFDTKPLTYSLNSENCDKTPNRIYIIEDSQLDIGLINAVDRNLHRILCIICDFLEWHEKMLEGRTHAVEDEEATKIIFTEGEIATEKPKRRGVGGLVDKIKGKFRKPKKAKKKGEPEEAENTADVVPPVDSEEAVEAPAEIEEIVEDAEVTEVSEEAEAVESETEEDLEEDTKSFANMSVSGGDSISVHYDAEADVETAEEGEEAPSEETIAQPPVHEVVFEEDGARKVEKQYSKTERRPYKERYYMLYGFDKMPECIDLEKTHTYLMGKGFDRNPLKQARDGQNAAEEMEKSYDPNKPGVRYCDFCGAELTGIEYETLKDGRDRCITCSRTAVKTAEELKELFDEVRIKMREFYGITINVGIKVEMVNSKKLHKKVGVRFVPTPGSDSRVLGVAIQDHNEFSLLIENGSPRMATIMTMTHELTHIWQYLNWDKKEIKEKYGQLELQVYEGMAKWAEVQYVYLIGEPALGKRSEILEASRPDVYGQGLLRFMAQYPLTEGTTLEGITPFTNVETPLDPKYCANVPQIVR
ncbi:MAG: hypothetical protein K6B42_02935 [Clostridia bacterium]|nr:hypothetical protein [Clostridia bacterium]